MNPINTFPLFFKIHSNMILPSTPRSSNCPFIMLLFTPLGIIPLISHYNVLSHLFILHSCCGVLSALQNKYTVMLKVSKNMFSVYVWIWSVSSAAAISTPFTAALCLNVFLTILIISHYSSARKLCKLLRVLQNTFNDIISVFYKLSSRWQNFLIFLDTACVQSRETHHDSKSLYVL